MIIFDLRPSRTAPDLKSGAIWGAKVPNEDIGCCKGSELPVGGVDQQTLDMVKMILLLC